MYDRSVEMSVEYTREIKAQHTAKIEITKKMLKCSTDLEIISEDTA
jgi:hypothetical protein